MTYLVWLIFKKIKNKNIFFLSWKEKNVYVHKIVHTFAFPFCVSLS